MRPTNEQIAKWQRMTDENDHDNVRIEIAEWIINNTRIIVDDCLEVYRAVKANHEKSGSLSTLMVFARIGADEVMRGRGGEDLARMIDDCL